jgi:hypothetical protein
MKKLLALAGAAALAACAAGSPAYAAERDGYNRHQVENQYRVFNHRDYRHNRGKHWDRRYRNPDFYSWHYYRAYPSYIYGRCDPRWNVRAIDPYTGRVVCLPRHVYHRYYQDRYGFSIRIDL